MRILLIKFTSLGDLIHALAAITDAASFFPSLKVDWMIDESFHEVALWHPAVDQIFKTSHRTWRKGIFSSIKPIWNLIHKVRQNDYDLIIDGQGNFKTALMSLFIKGRVAGFDRKSAREWIASFAYSQKFPASWSMHAIDRLRHLFALSLGYPIPQTPPNFRLDISRFSTPPDVPKPYIFFIHHASWKTKLWPLQHCQKLVQLICELGYHILLSWGNMEEKIRAQKICIHPKAILLPKLTLSEIAPLLLNAKAAVSMDTGLSHLAAALNVPTVTLYGPSDSGIIGSNGKLQIHLQSKLSCAPCHQKKCRFKVSSPPCLEALNPEEVLDKLALDTCNR